VRAAVDQQALEPLPTALMARAREEAKECVAQMRRRTASELDAARAAADQAVQDARIRGETEAATAVAIEDATVRRQVRTLLLAARRSVYEQLRTHIQSDVKQLHGEPIYRDLRATMTSAGRSLIGPGAVVREVDDGCVIEASGRRVEVTLESLADWALAGVLADAQGWTP
jgi:vacuolar-type H+-ATPase subunit E/Vma4